jgi:hypothetical protein
MFKPRSSYELSLIRGVICIRDLCEGVSVTNDAENVIADLAARKLLTDAAGTPRRIIYRDTMGIYDELEVVDGQFAGFKAIGKDELQDALDVVCGKGKRWPA